MPQSQPSLNLPFVFWLGYRKVFRAKRTRESHRYIKYMALEKNVNILGSHFFIWKLREKQLSNSLLCHETPKLSAYISKDFMRIKWNDKYKALGSLTASKCTVNDDFYLLYHKNWQAKCHGLFTVILTPFDRDPRQGPAFHLCLSTPHYIWLIRGAESLLKEWLTSLM